MKFIKTDQAPAPVGPYSQATYVNGFYFLAGQLGLDPKTGQFVGDDVQSQTDRAICNIINVLKSVNLTLNDICKCTIFLADMNEFKLMNEIYTKHFKDHRPSRSAVEVARLPLDARVEIEVIACKEK